MPTPSPSPSERPGHEHLARARRGPGSVTPSTWAFALAACALVAPAAARADVDLKFSGWISSDMRFRVLGEERAPPNPVPSQWSILKNGFSRNENRIRAALNLRIGDKIRGVADTELLLFGFSDLSDIDSTTLRNRVDPYYLEVHAAFIDINNLFGDVIPRFDLRIGRQTVPWGAADKFNPISNLNTLDLSDPLQFGRALANNMIRADWNPVGDLTFTAVLVPVFRPAQLPRTAPVALLDPLRPAPVANQGIRSALDDERAIYVPLYDPVTGTYLPSGRTLTITADVLAPEITASNMQFGFRATTKVKDQDIGISYYHGRFGIPVPAWSISTGTLDNNLTQTLLVYPRMDVLGLEMAGSIERLGGLGYWAEAAVIFPGEVGLMLGLVPVLLAFVGLPIEVRHVTLSTGQLAAAASTLGWSTLAHPAFWWCVAGLVATGTLNLGVSFWLALKVALRSRGITLADRRLLYAAVRQRLWQSPRSFLLPERS